MALMKKRDPFQWVLLTMVLITMVLSYMIYNKLDKKEKYSDACGPSGEVYLPFMYDRCCNGTIPYAGYTQTYCAGGPNWDNTCRTNVCVKYDGQVDGNCVEDCIKAGKNIQASYNGHIIPPGE